MKTTGQLLLSLVLATLSSAAARAQGGLPAGPRLLPYEGTLWDGGAPANGDYDFVFLLCNTADPVGCRLTNYDDPLNSGLWGTGVIWVGPHTNDDGYAVTVAQGNFSVMLGDVQALTDTVFATSDLYLGIAVRPVGGTFVELANRQRIAPDPYVHARQGGVDQFLVPTGAVMFFNLASCPTGWSPMAAAAGRAVVGLVAGGTLAGTVGSAMGNLSTRSITQVPAHYHTAGPLSGGANSAGNHAHTFQNGQGTVGYGDGGHVAFWSGSQGTTSTAGNHSHSVSIGAFNTNSTGSASVDVTMPYIQLLVCTKD